MTNIILLSLDEVRPDHLGCYGNSSIQTPNCDRLANEGVRLETCFSTSDFTPIAMGSVLTGRYPQGHGMRDPFCKLSAPNLATILKPLGYRTAGFSGNGILTRRHGFAAGFDFWDEPQPDGSWAETDYKAEQSEVFLEGNDWVGKCLMWLRQHAAKDASPVFVWGHYYETHGFSEQALLARGDIPADADPSNGYYAAKVEMADRMLIGPIVAVLEELSILDETILIVMADHGTNLGEKPVTALPWREGEVYYPQHTTLYQFDLQVPMIVRGPELPKGCMVSGRVRSMDLLPTVLSYLGKNPTDFGLDGESWLSFLDSRKIPDRQVYAEDLFERRGSGMLQAVIDGDVKFLRNLTAGTEEFYDLQQDPAETNNVVAEPPAEELLFLRSILNRHLLSSTTVTNSFSEHERGAIRDGLKHMGYFADS